MYAMYVTNLVKLPARTEFSMKVALEFQFLHEVAGTGMHKNKLMLSSEACMTKLLLQWLIITLHTFGLYFFHLIHVGYLGFLDASAGYCTYFIVLSSWIREKKMLLLPFLVEIIVQLRVL